MNSRRPTGPAGAVRTVPSARTRKTGPRLGRPGFPQAALLAVALLLNATAVRAAANEDAQYSLSPSQAGSGKPVTLTVSGYTGLCSPIFSHQKAAVEAGQIHLELLAENNPLAKCSDTTRPFHTDFQTPALAAGSYAVDIAFRPACSYQEPLCPFALIRYAAGTLTVRDAADLTFGILPNQVQAGQEFQLRLTRKEFACGAVFTNLADFANGSVMTLQYTPAEETVDTACPPLSPQGPVFTLGPLPAGTYQIMASQIPDCAGKVCPLALIAPQLAGTLTVVETVTGLKQNEIPVRSGTATAEAATDAGASALTRFRQGSLRLDGRARTAVRGKGAQHEIPVPSP
ncbi:MAG: hypothetical protein ABI036_01265 [Fibrobacteria bacterium]